MENVREFYVETPIGKMRVWAKYDVDDADGYPGVYIDLVPVRKAVDFADDYMVCCVEYDPHKNAIQTCVYQPSCDEPCAVIDYDGQFLSSNK